MLDHSCGRNGQTAYTAAQQARPGTCATGQVGAFTIELRALVLGWGGGELVGLYAGGV
jgi:hypothetical protein